MKHYENDNKHTPRHSAQPSGGKRYAVNEKQKPKAEKNVSGDTRLYPIKKKDTKKKIKTDVPATPTAPVPQMKAGYAPAFLFAAFIVAMAVWFIVSPKLSYSPSEKRYLADFPDASADRVLSGEFGSDFETYFADHFPARNMWVGVNAYTSLAEGNNGASGVYCGNGGYLINKPISKDNQLKKNLGILSEFKGIVGEIPVSAMFVPSTGYICSDKLPAIHESYNDDEYFEQAKKSLAEDKIGFIDLRDTFKTAYSGGSQLYYKTDHHWTTEGAYQAYLKYCETMGIKAAPRGTFTLEKYHGFYGTCYSTSGFWFTQPDTVEVWNNKDNAESIGVTIMEGEDSIRSDSMFFYDHDKDDDKYPIFLDGNHALTEIVNKNAKGGTVLVIKDSFSHCFAPFLAENYSKVILVDMRYYNNEVSEIVKVEKPEQILVLYGIDNFATDTDIVHLW